MHFHAFLSFFCSMLGFCSSICCIAHHYSIKKERDMKWEGNRNWKGLSSLGLNLISSLLIEHIWTTIILWVQYLCRSCLHCILIADLHAIFSSCFGTWWFRNEEEKTGVELYPMIVSGIVTGDSLDSYWPIISPSLVTVPEVFAKVNSPQYTSCF